MIDRSLSFPLFLAASIALHIVILFAVPATRTAHLSVRHGRFSVAVRVLPPTRSEAASTHAASVRSSETPSREPAAARMSARRTNARPRAAQTNVRPRSQRTNVQPLAETQPSAETAAADVGALYAAPAPALDNPAPVYPERARRDGQQGVVTLRLSVLADGTVGQIAVAASSGYELLDAAARRVAARYRFEPARRGGRAVTAEVLVPFEFRLRAGRWASRR